MRGVLEKSDEMDIYSQVVFTEKDYSLEMKVTRMLFTLNIPANIKGYQYIRAAVIMAVHDPEAVILITKIIYPEVARQYRTTPSRVERAIRHAIEVSWQRSDQDFLNSFFFAEQSTIRNRPTNREFISRLSEWVKMNGRI